jgi:hypothetical protein
MGDVENKTCGVWFTALNGPHEFDKHGPVPKENEHEEGGERAMAALNSIRDKSRLFILVSQLL